MRFFSITTNNSEGFPTTYVTSKSGTLKGYGEKGDFCISEVNIHTEEGFEILRQFSQRKGSDALQGALTTLHCRIKPRQAREQCVERDFRVITIKE